MVNMKVAKNKYNCQSYIHKIKVVI